MKDNTEIKIGHPFYYLDGIDLVKFIKFDDKMNAVICYPNSEVQDETLSVEFSRLKTESTIVNNITLQEPSNPLNSTILNPELGILYNVYDNDISKENIKSTARDILCARIKSGNWSDNKQDIHIEWAFDLAERFYKYSQKYK